MSKQRLQVLVDEAELRDVRDAAQRQGITMSEWVRQAMRDARRREPSLDVERKLRVISEAVQHNFPTGDIEQMLAEIEQGCSSPLPE